MCQFWKIHSAIILACVLALTRSQNSSSEENFSYDEHIVDGMNVDIEDAPYQVSIYFNGKHDCGGSIITGDKILTAAHCTYRRQHTDLSIRVGNTFHYDGKYFGVREYKQHPSFDIGRFEYDVAFLYLNNNLTFGAKVQPIKFARSRPKVGTRLLVTGWGTTRQGTISDHLQGAYVPLVSQKDCIDYYGTLISNDMLCAGYVQGGADSCQCDSGGPLVNILNGELVGVVSWGFGCGEVGYPGVYASVPNIFNNMQDNTDEFVVDDTEADYPIEDTYYDSQPTYEYT